MRKTILASLVCFLAGAALALAGDQMMGTWKLNEGKSKLAAGGPRNTTVIYEMAGDNVKIVVEGVDGDGKASRNEWVGKFDGKDYPVTGDSASDARAYTKVDDHTLDFTVKKGGKATVTGRVMVSADGKTRTVTTSGRDPNGKKMESTAVYDKK